MADLKTLPSGSHSLMHWHEPVGSFLIASPDPLPILCPEPNWEALEAKAR